MAKGRKTGGKPKGYKAPQTLAKEQAREAVRVLVTQALEPMTLAQIAHAQGISYMILRNPDGTYTRATNEAQVDAACQQGATAFEIFTQAPNTQAFTDLMNRALDKPAESALKVEHDLSDRLLAALDAIKARNRTKGHAG